MFQMVSPSIIKSLGLYIQHHTIQVLWLLVSKQPQNLHFLCLALCEFLYCDIFCRYLIWTNWWFTSQSAPVQFCTPIMLDARLPYANIWSVWLLVLLSGDCQVSLCTFLCGECVLFIIILLLVVKSIALIPFSFDVSCKLHSQLLA
jgi:hypothetical protein